MYSEVIQLKDRGVTRICCFTPFHFWGFRWWDSAGYIPSSDLLETAVVRGRQTMTSLEENIRQAKLGFGAHGVVLLRFRVLPWTSYWSGFCAQLRVVEHKFWFPEEALFVFFWGVGFEDSVVTRWGGQKSHWPGWRDRERDCGTTTFLISTTCCCNSVSRRTTCIVSKHREMILILKVQLCLLLSPFRGLLCLMVFVRTKWESTIFLSLYKGFHACVQQT